MVAALPTVLLIERSAASLSHSAMNFARVIEVNYSFETIVRYYLLN